MFSNGNLIFGAVVGFGSGLVSFYRGFRIYREYRILSDAPEIPIRSIAMGLVHIHGKAQGEKLVNSTVTRTPCYFYKVDIEKHQTDSSGNGSWRHYGTDINGVWFYLEDATGKVLIDAWKAEYDLVETCVRQAGGSSEGGGLTTLFGNRGYQAAGAGPSVTESALIT